MIRPGPIADLDHSGGGEPAPSFDTIPDIARKLRQQADRLAAREYYLLAILDRASGPVLTPCLDFGYVAGSLPPGTVAAHLTEAVAEPACAASTPIWWAPDERPVAGMEEVVFARRVASPIEEAGVALPLAGERGRKGVLVFLGPAMRVDDDTLVETHARSHALFSTVASLRTLDAGSARRMSRRELECLKLAANGLTSEEIARELGLSVHTANQYLLNTTQKLNAVNRVHAVAKALRAGLIA